ncbi:MAG: thioredoxin domain-containing protein [Patescibacteria group bacterium]
MEENKPQSQTNPSKLYIPAAILIGAVIIAGTILYANGGIKGKGVSLKQSGIQTGQQGKNFYEETAKRMGLNLDQFNACVAERKYKERVEKDQKEGLELGIGGTPGGFVNSTPLQGAIPYEQLKALIESALQKKNGGLPAGVTVTENDHIRGSFNAPVTLVEFSDFQCPFCARFHPTVQQALQEYGDKVRWVYKHFPLDQIHPQATPAAEASECIAEQKGNEGFWEFADAVFENQDRLKDIE